MCLGSESVIKKQRKNRGNASVMFGVYRLFSNRGFCDKFLCMYILYVCTADGSVLVWDSAQPGSASAVYVGGGGGGEGGGGSEVLACDWSKYDHHTLVTAGTDMAVK